MNIRVVSFTLEINAFGFGSGLALDHSDEIKQSSGSQGRTCWLSAFQSPICYFYWLSPTLNPPDRLPGLKAASSSGCQPWQL